MKLILCLAMSFLALPAHAQADDPTLFNPVTASQFEDPRIFPLDAAFGAEHGVAIPAPSDLYLPQHDQLHVRIIPTPVPGGAEVLAVEFSAIGASEDDLTFLENIQITDARIPMFEDQDDPLVARLNLAASLLQQQFYPAWLAAFPDAEPVGFEGVELGNSAAAVHLMITYRDPRQQAIMLTRAVVLLHPDQPESLFVTANIDLDRVPVTDAASLAGTLTSRVLNAWTFH
ncbi:hypothetical protein [Hasllibacter sp. MH4015]|uniref:hypothetical protein n=1 Tax=Hasllibacter sp. MH4015 TaxID=2854029 RepID=UPI001CD605D2|nr:hypothetical protein [Hasllibacter sp. MH4015]